MLAVCTGCPVRYLRSHRFARTIIAMSVPFASVSQPPPTAFDGAVYAELKRIAAHHLRTHADNATLCTTDLVHEAYLKLGAMPATDAVNGSPWQSRGHFFGAASRAMRQVLVDYARQRQAAKRGGGARAITLTGKHAEVEVRVDELLVLDEALDKLRALDERLCRVVELRYFAGLGDAEVAECLGVTLRTVGRDWVKARLFLSRELGHD
jgi:RNA polymerase sigma factor (TIGR02999 family)